jgi:hypothetical protein
MHEDMNKFWRQILRWLIADVPEQISIRAIKKQENINQPVVLKIRVRDKDFEPMDNVSVVIEIRDPRDQTIKLTAEPVFNETGVFEATYIPRHNGGYLARVWVIDAKNSKIGNTQTGWTIDLDALEFCSIKVNRPLLENIAQRTNGRIIELNELDQFAHSLPSQSAPITEIWIRPLWDLRWLSLSIFLVILLCLMGEWTLRRWRGMP